MVQDGMADEAKKPLTLGRGKLELKKTVETGQVRQSFSHGRSKVVQVERKRKRQFEMGADGKVQEVKAKAPATVKKPSAEEAADAVQRKLSEEEKAHRLKVLQDAKRAEEEERRQAWIQHYLAEGNYAEARALGWEGTEGLPEWKQYEMQQQAAQEAAIPTMMDLENL